jgi:hypothetical protein
VSPPASVASDSLSPSSHEFFEVGLGSGCVAHGGFVAQPWFDRYLDGESVAGFARSPAPVILTMGGSESTPKASGSPVVPREFHTAQRRLPRSASDVSLLALDQELGSHGIADTESDSTLGIPPCDRVSPTEGLASPKKRSKVIRGEGVDVSDGTVESPEPPPAPKLKAATTILRRRLKGKPLTDAAAYVKSLQSKRVQQEVTRELCELWPGLSSSYTVKALASVIKATYVLTAPDELRGRERFIRFRALGNSRAMTADSGVTCPSDAWVQFVTQVLGIQYLCGSSHKRVPAAEPPNSSEVTGVEITGKHVGTGGITAPIVAAILDALIKAGDGGVVLFS